MSRLVIPPLPEGWSGTPDDLIEFINENANISVDGELESTSISGQVGGSKPTEDVGIWFSRDSVERFINGKYQPISDVPVGSGIPWFGTFGAVPANYLECDGRSLLRSDYPELFSVIGISWGGDSTTFRLPDPAGRVPVGAGEGDYSLNQADGISGSMMLRAVGDYFGKGWLRRESKPSNFPAPAKSITPSTSVDAGAQYAATDVPAFVVNWIIKYR